MWRLVALRRLYRRNVDIAIHRPGPLAVDDSLDLTASRLLLAHLGILSLKSFDDLLAVQRFNEPDRKFNYLQNFSVLDKTKEYAFDRVFYAPFIPIHSSRALSLCVCVCVQTGDIPNWCHLCTVRAV